MKKVFISRELSKNSILKSIKEIDFVGQSLLSFSAIPFEVPECEWLFFYSQNGVKYFLEQEPIPEKKIATIGRKTAQLLVDYGYDVHFVGDGNPIKTANEYIRLKGTTCYVRAKESANSIKKIINHDTDNDIIVYDNQISNDLPQGDFDILIFTSTKNAQAFFKTRALNNEVVIAIGVPTRDYLESIGIKAIIPKEPTEESIYQLLLASFTF